MLTVDQCPVYAGECDHVGQRWGPRGYGNVSPRNGFKGGQPTNCRINAAILKAAKAGNQIDLWFTRFCSTRADRRAAEARLVRCLNPAWNKAKRT